MSTINGSATSPVWLKIFPTFAMFLENKFDMLGYGIDTDWNGNEHRLESNIATQRHQQRFTVPTHWYLCQALIVQAEKAKEGERKAGKQEIMKCEAILEVNKMAENVIHTANSRRVGSE